MQQGLHIHSVSDNPSEAPRWAKHGRGGFCWISLKTLYGPLSFSELKSIPADMQRSDLRAEYWVSVIHLLMGAQLGFYPRCWFQTPNRMMFSKRWISKSSSQTGLSFHMTMNSSGVRDRFPISVTVPDFFLMHIQGFMAFKYCSLDPVIFHLHCNVEQAKGYGTECDWPFNCLTYIKYRSSVVS